MSRFQAVLFIVGMPTVLSPCGARGRRILMKQGAVDCALRDLPGKPLYRSRCLKTHDRSNQIGTIESAFIVGDMFCIAGEVFEGQEISLAACEETMGVSYEANNCHVVDMRPERQWEIGRAEFVGAAVLLQKRAGHKERCLFWLEAQHGR